MKDETSLNVVDIYIEFSEWLLRNNYTNSIIIDNLLNAADLLLDKEVDSKHSNKGLSYQIDHVNLFSRISRAHLFSSSNNLPSQPINENINWNHNNHNNQINNNNTINNNTIGNNELNNNRNNLKK